MKREFFGSGGRPGISTVMVDAFNIMQDRITRARLAGDPPDLLISPRVGQIGWFDFHRAGDLIDMGARAAERAIDSIQEAIEPQGVGVVIEARHLCMMMRGVEKQHSSTVTSAMLGVFHQQNTRTEFLSLVQSRNHGNL